MRKLLIVIASVFYSTILSAQLKTLKSASALLTYTNGSERFTNNWTISPQLKPDIYRAAIKGRSAKISFISDIDSISFDVKPGDVFDFVVLQPGKDSAFTRIEGFPFVEPVIFSPAYIKTHSGKSFVEVPPVYELLNVAYAISEKGKKDPYIVYKNSDYYKNVTDEFGKYITHAFVRVIDSLLESGMYTALKMDAYSFEMDKKGKIRQSKVYDRIAGQQNLLRPYFTMMQDFSDAIQFRNFYDRHHSIYESQEKYYRDTLNSSEMMKWLNRNFPSTSYNSFKIIFTPLVAYNQSATWFENNNFREAQAHVNFPWPQDFAGWSNRSASIMRGNIVFTELNHAFINPEADKPVYIERVNNALKNLDKWIDRSKPAGNYNNSYAAFNEYMNWGLVSLRYIDLIDGEELQKMIDKNATNMKERRGFRKFPEFSKFLTGLYINRKPGQTIASLYPQIIEWFEKQNEEG